MPELKLERHCKKIEGIVQVFDENKKSRIFFAPEKPNVPQYIMDITEAKRYFGYSPKYTYIEMLKDMKKRRKEVCFKNGTV